MYSDQANTSGENNSGKPSAELYIHVLHVQCITVIIISVIQTFIVIPVVVYRVVC